MQNSVNRLRFVDIAKGIAMIYIILGHVHVRLYCFYKFSCHIGYYLLFGAEKASFNWRRNRSAIGVKV